MNLNPTAESELAPQVLGIFRKSQRQDRDVNKNLSRFYCQITFFTFYSFVTFLENISLLLLLMADFFGGVCITCQTQFCFTYSRYQIKPSQQLYEVCILIISIEGILPSIYFFFNQAFYQVHLHPFILFFFHSTSGCASWCFRCWE